MSGGRRRRRRKSERVLKAISSPLRLQILNLLFDRGPLSYTEVMNTLRLNPSRDAGRFAYHLKFLLKAGLIEPDAKIKKYCITHLGQMTLNIAEDIDEYVSKSKELLVRTSQFSIEDFDRYKIVDSLIREATVPADLAQKIARETERRLREFKIKYLTAPLIREFVNAILIEKGLEEYRHKLTRLGLPVYDVTQLIKSITATSTGVKAIHKAAGDAVIEEYVLLNVLPRDIADAHLSGTLHISDLGSWILQLSRFIHDLRFFLRFGLTSVRTDLGLSYPPPKSLRSALSIVSNIFKIAAKEISGEQAIDYFNVFLAPYVRGLSKKEIKENLHFFIFNLNQPFSDTGSPVKTSLGIEFGIPDFLGEKKAVGPNGKIRGSYSDFIEESNLIASLLLEIMSEEGERKPVFNPGLIIKIRSEVLKSEEFEPLLFQSHKLAVENGTPFFANLTLKNQKHASYTATGCRIADDWTKDWEQDTLRIGGVGNVIINLPRTSYDSGGKQARFFELLDERLEMVLRALEIKYRQIKQRLREGLLPFLTHKVDGDQYFRLENTFRSVSLVGLNETIKSLSEKNLHENADALDLSEKIIRFLSSNVQKNVKKREEARVNLSLSSNANAAKRLAQLDVERYGWGRVCTQGAKGQPYYTNMFVVPLESGLSWKERLSIEERFHGLTPGGHLAVIQLDDPKRDPDAFLSVTKYILKTYKLGLYTYNPNLS